MAAFADSRESQLLRCLVDRPGRVLSCDQLIEWTRGQSADTFDRNVGVQVSRLRKKKVENGVAEGGLTTDRNTSSPRPHGPDDRGLKS